MVYFKRAARCRPEVYGSGAGVKHRKFGPGDWRPLVENNPIDAENSINETDSEKMLSDQELKKTCFDYARNTFQGKKFTNKETGREIIVSKDGIGEWKTKTKSREQTLSIKILDRLLENALHTHDTTDKQNRKNIDKISYFSSNCKVNGKEYNAVITVRNIKNYGDKYYHHYLEDIKIEPHSGITRPAGEPG
jgi:hypothetical protein